jgi:hypothetical protein
VSDLREDWMTHADEVLADEGKTTSQEPLPWASMRAG